ncbi:unnamed protein product (macronuclear) [Paramecium tetraurelia]|uniref:Protein kinase domain-containing protein n=1 Tax=Paramecium tetraurelia TaxID=5888 RepID=A0DGM5_PARTE|nr:uncharacterized protein GSPATT00002321001 [Paramecium tetraurelia]CAK82192.1 unnamed protein product [Paramecium tetraurelia]|eukprot:XP_001449589.1 hypothetical protein (macronuclear) [Paramecium tetraurelia strain d4-2]
MNNNTSNIRKTISNYSYEQNDLIGSGYSSKVYKGMNTKNNQVVAIKVISFQQLITPISKSLLKNEIHVLSLIDHPNLMKIYETFETKNNRYLICEYCNEGDLAEILESKKFTETQSLEELKHYMIKKQYIEISSQPNILKSNGYYKLADFGFAVIENQYESIIKKFNVGTPMYMAPETVQNNVYSEKSDIWALGIVLFQMIYHQLPQLSKQEHDLNKKHQFLINKIKNDAETSHKTKELMLNMLNFDPEKRLSINEVISNVQIQTKKISTLQHHNIPCRSIKTSFISQDLQQSRQQLNDQTSNSKLFQTQQEDTIENYLKQPQLLKSTELNDFQNWLSIQMQKINSMIQQFRTLKIKTNLKDKQSKFLTQKKQIQHQNSFNNHLSNFIINIMSPDLKHKKSLELLEISNQEKEKISSIKMPMAKQHELNNLKSDYTKKGNSIDESECIQHSNQNSTNDTIKHNQFSNCQQILSEKHQILDIQQHQPKPQFSIQNNNSIQQKKSPVRITQSQQTIITPPFKSSAVSLSKNSQDTKKNYYFQSNISSQLNQYSYQQKQISNVINEKFTSDFTSNYQDDKVEFLSASIRPTYKFLEYINNVLKQFDCINTEDKQKCYFLIRKLIGIKATYIQNQFPTIKQEIIKGWIDSFLTYYSKVESVFYISPDKQFEQFFNKDLSEFTLSFSQLLLHYLRKINIVKLQKEFQIIQEILLENQKQRNDPILFARRWENDQL